MIERLVIATHNAKKAGEMVMILGRRFPSLEILTLADFEDAPEPEETGGTYAENAAIKAESAALFTGEWCVADDAGLEIDALPGELGVWSKRFAGEETTFPEKMAIILERLRDVPDSQRSARFHAAVALCAPGRDSEIFEAECEGRIEHEPRGSGGFGYDPIFFLPEIGRAMAELSADEKHAISHRGKVLALLASRLDELMGIVI